MLPLTPFLVAGGPHKTTQSLHIGWPRRSTCSSCCKHVAIPLEAMFVMMVSRFSRKMKNLKICGLK